jgi:hypothetical protein
VIARLSVVLLLSVALLSSTAQAGLIDFDDLPIGPVAGNSLTVEADGVEVTFSGNQLQIVSYEAGSFGQYFPGTGNQITAGGDWVGDLIVEIESGYTFDFIEIENHLSGDPPLYETDIITGMAYASNGALIDSFTSGLEIATLTGPGITRATFGAFETAFAIDNFRFTAIPEPSVAWLIAVGLAALASGARRDGHAPRR